MRNCHADEFFEHVCGTPTVTELQASANIVVFSALIPGLNNDAIIMPANWAF
jgi:hypothetical protein